MSDFDRTRTLDELEEVDWGEPTFPSRLVVTCHALRKKPIGEFMTEDLRIMIGQNISLPFLMPLALEVLRQNPLAEGDFYEGDLLSSVLRVDAEFWRANPAFYNEVSRILSQVPRLPDEITRYAEQFQRIGFATHL